MENLAHSFFGAVLYRSAFERYLPNSLPFLIVGANLPDLDVVVNFFGKIAYLNHHRGLTHSIPGIIVLSTLLATVWFFWQKWRSSSSSKSNNSSTPNTVSPLMIFLASLASVATHPMLDYLNNYGVRPLLPWNNKWFYGDLVFIIDPWMWLILGGAIFLSGIRSRNLAAIWLTLSILAWLVMFLSGRVPNTSLIIWTSGIFLLIVIRLKLKDWLTSTGRPIIASLALFLLCSYLSGLHYFQAQALRKAEDYFKNKLETREVVSKFSVSPTTANPFKWEFLGESENYFYFGTINLISNEVSTPKKIFVDRTSPILQEALSTVEGKAIKAFSRYLIAEQEKNPTGTTVILCDGRYVRDFHSSHPEFACIRVLVPNKTVLKP